MAARKLWALRTSQSGCGDVRLISDGVSLLAEYEYRSNGQDWIGGVQFEEVIAHRFRDEMHSQGFDPSSYDTVVELAESEWIEALAKAEPDGIWGMKGKKHFAILLSNNGYLEVVARSCEELDSRSGTLS